MNSADLRDKIMNFEGLVWVSPLHPGVETKEELLERYRCEVISETHADIKDLFAKKRCGLWAEEKLDECIREHQELV